MATTLHIVAQPKRLPLLTVIHCPRVGCTYAASAISEGRAIKSIVAHLIKAHHVTHEVPHERAS